MTGPKRVEPSNGGLMNKGFKYRGHADTDVSATFARIRKQQKAEADALNAANVRPIKKARTA